MFLQLIYWSNLPMKCFPPHIRVKSPHEIFPLSYTGQISQRNVPPTHIRVKYPHEMFPLLYKGQISPRNVPPSHINVKSSHEMLPLLIYGWNLPTKCYPFSYTGKISPRNLSLPRVLVSAAGDRLSISTESGPQTKAGWTAGPREGPNCETDVKAVVAHVLNITHSELACFVTIKIIS